MGYKTILPFSTETAFSPGAYTGYNPLSFSLGDYANAPPVAPVSALANYSPSSFVGDLSGMSVQPTGFMESDFMKNMLGYKAADGTQHMGWGGLALGAGQALFGAWDSMRNYNLQKEQLAFNKAAFAKNWDAQRKTTNSQLEDRQVARLASRQGADSSPYQSVGDYMKQNGIA